MKQSQKPKEDLQTREVLGGTMTDFVDLYFREEKRCRTIFIGQPHKYRYLISISKDKRVTCAQIFYEGYLVGAGVSRRCVGDNYIEAAGNRLAISRALTSIGLE